MNCKGKYYAHEFEPHECTIFVQSTKIGTNVNKAIHSSTLIQWHGHLFSFGFLLFCNIDFPIRELKTRSILTINTLCLCYFVNSYSLIDARRIPDDRQYVLIDIEALGSCLFLKFTKYKILTTALDLLAEGVDLHCILP